MGKKYLWGLFVGSGRMSSLFSFFFFITRKKISEAPFDPKACFVNVLTSGSASNPILRRSLATPHRVPRAGSHKPNSPHAWFRPLRLQSEANRILSGQTQLVVARSVRLCKSLGPGGQRFLNRLWMRPRAQHSAGTKWDSGWVRCMPRTTEKGGWASHQGKFQVNFFFLSFKNCFIEAYKKIYKC